MSPPADAIEAALAAARQSPCAKSKRGVAVYLAGAFPHVYGVGFNGLPGGLPCTGDAFCRRTCGQRCVHAEVRAIRDAKLPRAFAFDAVHVKVAAAGQLVAGGPPSCWQCAREVLDVGLAGFWLYEGGFHSTTARARWVRYTAAEFHAVTMVNCGLADGALPDDDSDWSPSPCRTGGCGASLMTRWRFCPDCGTPCGPPRRTQ